MCEVCRQYPCHPRCPNAPEPTAIEDCMKCNETIRVGDEYYEIEGYAYCQDCVDHTWFDDDEKESIECECCGKTIGFDEECYVLNGKYYCPECVDEKIAEEDY